MRSVSGVGVLDKAVSVLDALEGGPLPLAALTEATGLSRATTHRLATALEVHGFVDRDGEGRFRLGARLAALSLPAVARPVLERLRDVTGESVQLYVRRGDLRLCVSAIESPHGLRTIVPVGALLPLDRGSAGRVLAGRTGPGWVESVEERQVGVASVSAPVHAPDGQIVAAVSVSGPVDRTTRQPGRRYGPGVAEAAAGIEQALTPFWSGSAGPEAPQR